MDCDTIIYQKEIVDFENYAKNYLKIKNKAGQIVSFIFNNAQRIVHNIIEQTRKSGKLLRFIVLKARQEGVSTYFEGRKYHRTANQFNRKAVIIGHETDASTNLFDMFKRFQQYNPLAPAIKHSNEKKLSFSQLNSEIKITTAEGREKVKRSDTIQDLHCTEVAFWPDAKSTMGALLQTVPRTKNTMIVVESTANGVGGWFYDTWQGANAKPPENDFIPIFLSWFDFSEYSMDFNSESEKQEFAQMLNKDEKNLIAKFNLTLEQLNWRRVCIKNECSGDINLFNQEYPATPEDAFLTTGRPVFDIQKCRENMLKCKDPIKIGDLIYKYDGDKIIGVEFVENSRGYIKQYLPIVVNEREQYVYCGGGDVAEGLEQGDYSCMYYMDRRLNKIALAWHGHIDADLLAEEQHKIQLYLRSCYVNNEVNNHGLTTVNRAYQLNVNQYYREDFEMGYEMQKDKIGFKTTSGTKPILINNLQEAIREDEFNCNDADFWKETLTFVRNERGQMQAQNKDKDPATKCYDDRVMAMALMWRCHLWLPSYKEIARQEIYARPPIVERVDSVVRF